VARTAAITNQRLIGYRLSELTRKTEAYLCMSFGFLLLFLHPPQVFSFADVTQYEGAANENMFDCSL
jgi:hypothetical protein